MDPVKNQQILQFVRERTAFYTNYKVKQLRTMLKERKMDKNGRKHVLVSRLVEADQSAKYDQLQDHRINNILMFKPTVEQMPNDRIDEAEPSHSEIDHLLQQWYVYMIGKLIYENFYENEKHTSARLESVSVLNKIVTVKWSLLSDDIYNMDRYSVDIARIKSDMYIGPFRYKVGEKYEFVDEDEDEDDEDGAVDMCKVYGDQNPIIIAENNGIVRL